MLQTIESEAFEGYTSLAVFHDISALETIAEMVFLNCISLTEVTLGPAVKCTAQDPNAEKCRVTHAKGYHRQGGETFGDYRGVQYLVSCIPRAYIIVLLR